MVDITKNKNFFEENPKMDEVFKKALEGFQKIQTFSQTSTIDEFRGNLETEDFLENIEDAGKYFDLLKKKENLIGELNSIEITEFAKNKSFLSQIKDKYKNKKDDVYVVANLDPNDLTQVNAAIDAIKAVKNSLETKFKKDYIENFNKTEKNKAEEKVKKILIEAFKSDDLVVNHFTKMADKINKKDQGISIEQQKDPKDPTKITGFNFAFSSKINDQKVLPANTLKPSTEIILDAFNEISFNIQNNIFDALTKTALKETEKNSISYKNLEDDLSQSDKTFDDLNQTDQPLKQYFKEVLIDKGSLKSDLFIQKKLISDYLDYLTKEKQNQLIFEKTKITNPEKASEEIFISEYIKEQKKKFEKIFTDFEKKIKDNKDLKYDDEGVDDNKVLGFKSEYDKLQESIKTEIINHIQDNVLQKYADINKKFHTQNVKPFDDDDKDLKEITKILLKQENSESFVGRMSTKGKHVFENLSGSSYFSKKEIDNSGAQIEKSDGLKTKLFTNEGELKKILGKIKWPNDPKDSSKGEIEALFLNIQPSDQKVYFDCKLLIEGIAKTAKFASSPVILMFEEKVSTSSPPYAKISTNLKGGQEIEISGAGMFVELTQKKLPDLKKKSPGLKSVFIMQDSSGKLGFYNKEGQVINNKNVIDYVKQCIGKDSLKVNGEDIHGLTEKLSASMPTIVSTSGGIGTGRRI